MNIKNKIIVDKILAKSSKKISKFAQAAPSGGLASMISGANDSDMSQRAAQAKSWITSGDFYKFNVPGPMYDVLDNSDKVKVLQYYVRELSGGQSENAINAIIRGNPGIAADLKRQGPIRAQKEYLKSKFKEEMEMLLTQQPKTTTPEPKPTTTPAGAPPTATDSTAKPGSPGTPASSPSTPAATPGSGTGASRRRSRSRPAGAGAAGAGAAGAGAAGAGAAENLAPAEKSVAEASTPQAQAQASSGSQIDTSAPTPKYHFPNKAQAAELGHHGPYMVDGKKRYFEVRFNEDSGEFVFTGNHVDK